MSCFQFDRWFEPPTQRFFMVKRNGKILFCGIQQGGEKAFGVIALEVDALKDTVGLNAMQIAERVLHNHSHEIIGERKTLAGAMKLGDRYIAKWCKRQTQSKRCNCGPIGAKKAA